MGSGERFDSITRLFGSSLSRRQAIKLAVGSALGTAGVVALQQGTASAACDAAQCTALGGVCCPPTPFPGTNVCATPAFPVCCGAQACAAAPFQQCCPGTSPFAPFNQVTPPFCAPGTPATHQCCGPIVCVLGVSFCAQGVTPGGFCCLPVAAPAGSTCCGNLPFGCPPGTVCVEYPPGVFNCQPVPSDRNIKENVVPVAW